MLALISEASCLLYSFLCLYDSILAFWPHLTQRLSLQPPKASVTDDVAHLPRSYQSLIWKIQGKIFLFLIQIGRRMGF